MTDAKVQLWSPDYLRKENAVDDVLEDGKLC